jgi:hypothetical protein
MNGFFECMTGRRSETKKLFELVRRNRLRFVLNIIDQIFIEILMCKFHKLYVRYQRLEWIFNLNFFFELIEIELLKLCIISLDSSIFVRLDLTTGGQQFLLRTTTLNIFLFLEWVDLEKRRSIIFEVFFSLHDHGLNR